MSLPTGPAGEKPSPLGFWTRRRLIWAGGAALVAWLILLLVLTTVRPKEPDPLGAPVSSAPRRTTTTGPPEVDSPPTCPALDPTTSETIAATLQEGTVLLESNQWVSEGDMSFVAGNVYDEESDERLAAAALWLIKGGEPFTLNAEARKVSSAPNGVEQLPLPVSSYGAPSAALSCTRNMEHIPR